MLWKVTPFNPLKRQTKFWPLIPSNNRFLLFLFVITYIKLWNSWDKWLITIKPVRLLHSPSCVKTPRAQNRSEDWQLPLPEDTSLLLVLICANASACGGVSILHRRGLGTLVRISQSALIECKEQVSGAAAVHSMLHVYCAVCVCASLHGYHVWYGEQYRSLCSDAQFWIQKFSIRCCHPLSYRIQ